MESIIPTVGVVVLDGDKVLLVEHTEASGHVTGAYGLPAGRVEAGETFEDVAVRELFEETGLKTSKEDLIHLPKSYKATLQRKDGVKTFSFDVFLCKKYSGGLKEGEETIPRWVSRSELGTLNVLPNVADAIVQAEGL